MLTPLAVKEKQQSFRETRAETVKKKIIDIVEEALIQSPMSIYNVHPVDITSFKIDATMSREKYEEVMALIDDELSKAGWVANIEASFIRGVRILIRIRAKQPTKKKGDIDEG